jgi:hypothetical protein
MVKTAVYFFIASLPLSFTGTSQALVHFDFEQPYFIESGVLIKDHSLSRVGSVYHLFYLRGNSTDIGHATSTDLVHWDLAPPVMYVEPGTWDEKALWAPQVLPFPSGGYIMYYTGVNNQWSQQTGCALSNDLLWWWKHNEPVYHPDPAWAEWADSTWSHGRDPFVFEHEGTLYMLLTAKNKWNRGAIASAVSQNYITWEDNGPIYIHDSWHVLESVQCIYRNSKFHLFFTEETVYGTSHMMSDSLYSGWDSSARVKIDLGQAPEIDLFDGNYIFSRHDGYYDEFGITNYLIRFDSLRWAEDTPVIHQPWPLSKNWNHTFGNAFTSQPTFGNNPYIRGDSVDVGFEGHCWIGTNEHYQGPLMDGSPGSSLGDSALGLIRSKPFVITGNSMNLLVGGGNYPGTCYVALIEYGTWEHLFRETGENTEVMTRRYWDLVPHRGKTVYVEIADLSQAPFGHINVDDITESIDFLTEPEEGEDSRKSKSKSHHTEPKDQTLTRFTLFRNVPNPFNPTTTISYYLPYESQARIDVFDINGALVHQLLDNFQPEGLHAVSWNGRNGRGETVSTGIYFYRLIADGNIIDTKKMLFIK